jgi:hypothetical protein
LVITNISAAGRNPAQGDRLKANYVYDDPDSDLEDQAIRTLNWSADGVVITGATTDEFIPVAAQNKQFLSFSIIPGSMPPADPNKAAAPVMSPDSGGPVLPSRAQLAAAYSPAPNSLRWGDAYMYCAGQSKRLPTASELQALFTTYTRSNAVGTDGGGDLNRTYGWQGGDVYWSSQGDEARHSYVYIMTNGGQATNVNSNTYRFACANTGTPELLPTVTAASIPAATVGVPVTAVYTYNGNSTIPDRSRFQWSTATASNGTTGKTPIYGATAASYTPVAADGGKWLVFEIIPASYDTVVGTPFVTVGSAPVSKLPTITDVSISGYDAWGTPQIGGTLKGEYTFNANGGSADGSTYRWLNGSRSSTDRTYILTKDDVGKTLTFEVTAKSTTGAQGNVQSANANKRVSSLKLFRKPNTIKYSKNDLPGLKPPYADAASRECRYSTSHPVQRLPTRNELTRLFADETSGGNSNEMCTKHGWPMSAMCGGSGNEARYWTNENHNPTESYHVNLHTGAVSQTSNVNGFYVTCVD